jgi:hypothetical protein
MQRAIPEGVKLFRYAAHRSRLFHMSGTVASDEPSASAKTASLAGHASPAEPSGEKQRGRALQCVDHMFRLDMSVPCGCDSGLFVCWTYAVVLRLQAASPGWTDHACSHTVTVGIFCKKKLWHCVGAA